MSNTNEQFESERRDLVMRLYEHHLGNFGRMDAEIVNAKLQISRALGRFRDRQHPLFYDSLMKVLRAETIEQAQDVFTDFRDDSEKIN